MERKRDKQIEKLFEGNTSHWIGQGEGHSSGGAPAFRESLQTDLCTPCSWSSFLSGREGPTSSSSSGVRASSFQSLVHPFRCPGPWARLSYPLSGPPRDSWDKYFCGGRGQSGEGERQW